MRLFIMCNTTISSTIFIKLLDTAFDATDPQHVLNETATLSLSLSLSLFFFHHTTCISDLDLRMGPKCKLNESKLNYDDRNQMNMTQIIPLFFFQDGIES
ncbi:unnamed protein product [Mucor hiemalis]